MLLTFRGRAFVKIRLVGIVLSFRGSGSCIQGVSIRSLRTRAMRVRGSGLLVGAAWGPGLIIPRSPAIYLS